MKNFLFICAALMVITGITSCQKDDKKATPRFLDVKVRFSGVTKPNPGDVLVLNLHYGEVAGESYRELPIDASQSITLDQQQIEDGFRATFEEYPMEETIYLSAYIDVDQDGEMGTGDFALFYPNVTLNDVESGANTAENITEEYVVTIDMDVAIGGSAGGVVDIDGNVYESVIIGGQEWMKENLKVTRYRDGTPIPTGLSNEDWENATSGAYSIYPYENAEGIDSEEQMIATFGLLYNWYTVDNPVGICPEGWRVPTDNEWKELEISVGMLASEADEAAWRGNVAPFLKSPEGWIDDSEPGTDDYGFSVTAAGARYPNGSYNRFGTYAYFWTSTPSGTQGDRAIRRLFMAGDVTINRSNRPSVEGQCIRCIKDQ